MHKTIVATVAIVALAAVAAVYIWSSHNRYYLVTRSGGGVAGIQHPGDVYEIDKKTGQTWFVGNESKWAVVDSATRLQEGRPLPTEELVKVTGNAALSNYGRFSADIYNGSSWVLTKMTITVTAKEKDGTIRWSRDFSDTVTIRPLSTGYFSVSVAGYEGVAGISWRIAEVFGYLPQRSAKR